MNTPVSTAILGASGYTGEELVRICVRHPGMKVTAITSRQLKGKTLGETLGIVGKAGAMRFEDLSAGEVAKKADVFFLALPHGVSAAIGGELRAAGKKVFDLSADFRLKDAALYEKTYGVVHPAPARLAEAVYGLPEIYGEKIKQADLVACPGCYPTTAILGLAPALQAGVVADGGIVISAMSGVSGAGKKVESAYLFGECHDNLRAYSIPQHRHRPEIEQELSAIAGSAVRVAFVPHLAPLHRGMLTSISFPLKKGTSAAELDKVYRKFYRKAVAVRVLEGEALPETKRMVGRHGAELAVRVDEWTGRGLVIVAIDNLGKGAAGQAVHCFNLRHGCAEGEGLDW
ncbi:MAG: N-acetyl-gamma-glutamyl-phosphate reductase [Verrucomicrobia bacterium]|nr:N-acetyl-gamma-glutamyl-phosphate reductase [Verrucomicrobiota bacterium]